MALPHNRLGTSLQQTPISWVKKHLDFQVGRHLKQWTGLAKSANTSCSCLFLPKSMGGPELPLISITYKKLQCAKAASLMSSRDSLVHHLASQKTLAEASTVRQSFRRNQQVVEVLREDPGASRKVIVVRAKSAVVQADMQVHPEQRSAVDGLCRDRPEVVPGQSSSRIVGSRGDITTREHHEVCPQHSHIHTAP